MIVAPIDEPRTDRLRVTRWGARLADDRARARLTGTIRAMLTDPVLAHLPPQLAETHDFETWTVERRNAADVMLIETVAEGALAGLLFLAPGPEGEWHLGYLLAEPYWGRGYASEVAQAVVANWPAEAGPLWAGVAEGNPASARVLEKAGFTEDSEAAPEGMRIYHFRAG